ncbi:ER protein Pkr1 domain-containing protein [Trichoderma aethiopicum]
MASFFVELWEGIFTPGPTPTILKATNITFAALQLVLGSLLLATHSVHFVVLSVLCGGLWWSVNWFARELRVAQAAQEEQEKQKKLGVPASLGGAAAAAAAGDASDSSDTEVEGRVTRRRSARNKKSAAATAKADVEPVEKRGELKQRSLAESVSSVSTEDEWERVSENEREKEK